MIDKSKIVEEFSKHGGVLKTSELNAIGLNSRQIRKLLDQGELTKIKQGYYELAEEVNPLSIGLEANYRGKVSAEDVVLVIGSGTIGLMVAAAAKYIGAEVIMTDLDNRKLKIAEKLGADHIINAKEHDTGEIVKKLTTGEGPSVVIEAVGSEETIKNAISYTSAAGRVVILGIVDEEVAVSIFELIKKEVDFLGSRLNNYMFSKVIEILKDIDLKPLLNKIKIYSLSEAEKAFTEKIKNPNISIKSLIDFIP